MISEKRKYIISNGKLHNGKWKMIQWKMENEDEKSNVWKRSNEKI